MASGLLLRNGIVLLHDREDHVIPTKCDVLIRGNLIRDIKPSIEAEAGIEVIDCKSKIISPGFIDAHHHLWQTQLRGRHADDTLLDYVPKGNLQSSNFTKEDIFWGQLGGCLEAIDAGTTTVLDHAHMNVTADHSRFGLAATASSGLRSIFCYGLNQGLKSWDPPQPNLNILGDHVMPVFEELAASAPFADGRVELGFAFDSWFLPDAVLVGLIHKIKAAGVRLISTHASEFGKAENLTNIGKAKNLGLLDKSIIWAHACRASEQDITDLQESGSTFVSTASTELQMGHGLPLAYRSEAQALLHRTGIGIDCQANATASMPNEMRLGLQSARGFRNHLLQSQGLEPLTVSPCVETAFNLGTIYGSRALGLTDKIGSIEVGKHADLVVFDATSPSMVCGATADPVATIVLHSSPRDVQHVIIDGIFRKRDGNLVQTTIEEPVKSSLGVVEVHWPDVVKALSLSQDQFLARTSNLDYGQVRKLLTSVLGLEEDRFVDTVSKSKQKL